MPPIHELDEFAVVVGIALLFCAGCVAVGMWLVYELWR